jgi:translation initiation factor eIF-2B subunit epsilon
VYLWTLRSDDDDVDIRNIKLGSLAFNMRDLVLNEEDIAESASDVGESDDDDSDIGSINGAWALETSLAKKTEEFKKEIAQTIERSMNEDHTVYTAALEVTGLRMSSNGSYTDVREVMIPIIMGHIDSAANLKTVFTKWAPLVGKMTHTPDDQLHVLQVLQKYCASDEHVGKLFLGALQMFYNADILEEDAILRWFNSDLSKATPAEEKIRDRSTKFIDWLEEAEEESEEESDDE